MAKQILFIMLFPHSATITHDTSLDEAGYFQNRLGNDMIVTMGDGLRGKFDTSKKAAGMILEQRRRVCTPACTAPFRLKLFGD
ncbi:hypothetical protein HUU40_32395 [candidate division KSB1 bacterium]|nr:hypothetical protein [candidate division KSB1 bacterium]